MKIEIGQNLSIVVVALCVCCVVTTCMIVATEPSETVNKIHRTIYKNCSEDQEYKEHVRLREQFIKEVGDKGLSVEDIDYLYDDELKKELLRHESKKRK